MYTAELSANPPCCIDPQTLESKPDDCNGYYTYQLSFFAPELMNRLFRGVKLMFIFF